MLKTLTELIKYKNARKKAEIISSYVGVCVSVLDFGCGDLSMAHELRKLNPKLAITGIDVVDFGKRYPHVRFQKFNGRKIPFGANTFDLVIAYHVFHHTDNPRELFAECCRIARKRILFVEPTYRVALELPGMALMDWLFNFWKEKKISMSYHFYPKSWWFRAIQEERMKLIEVADVELLPVWFPTGRSLLFIVDKP